MRWRTQTNIPTREPVRSQEALISRKLYAILEPEFENLNIAELICVDAVCRSNESMTVSIQRCRVFEQKQHEHTIDLYQMVLSKI